MTLKRASNPQEAIDQLDATVLFLLRESKIPLNDAYLANQIRRDFMILQGEIAEFLGRTTISAVNGSLHRLLRAARISPKRIGTELFFEAKSLLDVIAEQAD